MAFDLIKGQQRRDWSCGIGDDPPLERGASRLAAVGAIAAAAAVAGVGTLLALEMSSRRPAARTAPPTMIVTPGRKGHSVNPQARRYFRG